MLKTKLHFPYAIFRVNEWEESKMKNDHPTNLAKKYTKTNHALRVICICAAALSTKSCRFPLVEVTKTFYARTEF
jgi:hypothetical protein